MTLVTGDPASMRAAAAQLRANAETLSGVASQVDGSVVGMTYAGPAADRFRGSIATRAASSGRSAPGWSTSADTLMRQAAVVEEQTLLAAAQEEVLT